MEQAIKSARSSCSAKVTKAELKAAALLIALRVGHRMRGDHVHSAATAALWIEEGVESTERYRDKLWRPLYWWERAECALAAEDEADEWFAYATRAAVAVSFGGRKELEVQRRLAAALDRMIPARARYELVARLSDTGDSSESPVACRRGYAVRVHGYELIESVVEDHLIARRRKGRNE